jgi:hypothetical protein
MAAIADSITAQFSQIINNRGLRNPGLILIVKKIQLYLRGDSTEKTTQQDIFTQLIKSSQSPFDSDSPAYSEAPLLQLKTKISTTLELIHTSHNAEEGSQPVKVLEKLTDLFKEAAQLLASARIQEAWMKEQQAKVTSFIEFL